MCAADAISIMKFDTQNWLCVGTVKDHASDKSVGGFSDGEDRKVYR